MVELSFLARLVLTLLLSALSLFVYKRLQTPPSATPQPPTKRPKKRSKKKSSKKSTVSDPPSPPQQSPKYPQASAAPDTSTSIADEENISDSDSDDGLSAAQVLATRKFKPKNLGGTRLARKIKASLPTADAPKFTVEQEVLARFGGGDEWFPAIVLEQRKGNEYHLKYDDGEVEYRVPAEFIKPRAAKTDDDSEDVQVPEAEQMMEAAVAQEELSGSDSSDSDDDDGWQVVGTSNTAKRQARRVQAAAPAEPLVDGLTKRQRENRRKKERQREKKEMLRQHAQKDDLDARARWRYVPS
ncbi:hypothetical protein P3T76_011353 [Phytophthora citrophthora]|uniref:Agenet domain-containing protein n=1 Tax=Phytophthora citrophthora TaxID=4793 RepID=A0AAD9G993_9STRA|nr:hypothetical protein P3T76_011353 [Phytophthora citrophthora]